MKNLLFLVFIITTFLGCSSNDDSVQNNPYLPNAQFDTGSLINTNLPQFSNLLLPGNHVVLEPPYGINGVVLYHAGNSNYHAFELSDPNHNLSSGCSKLAVEGITATCNCNDGNSYEILTGTGQDGTTGQYTLIRYFVELSGNIIRVYNN